MKYILPTQADWDNENDGLIEFITTNELKMNVDAIDFSRSEIRDSAGTSPCFKELLSRKHVNGEKNVTG